MAVLISALLILSSLPASAATKFSLWECQDSLTSGFINVSKVFRAEVESVVDRALKIERILLLDEEKDDAESLDIKEFRSLGKEQDRIFRAFAKKVFLRERESAQVLAEIALGSKEPMPRKAIALKLLGKLDKKELARVAPLFEDELALFFGRILKEARAEGVELGMEARQFFLEYFSELLSLLKKASLVSKETRVKRQAQLLRLYDRFLDFIDEGFASPLADDARDYLIEGIVNLSNKNDTTGVLQLLSRMQEYRDRDFGASLRELSNALRMRKLVTPELVTAVYSLYTKRILPDLTELLSRLSEASSQDSNAARIVAHVAEDVGGIIGFLNTYIRQRPSVVSRLLWDLFHGSEERPLNLQERAYFQAYAIALVISARSGAVAREDLVPFYALARKLFWDTPRFSKPGEKEAKDEQELFDADVPGASAQEALVFALERLASLPPRVGFADPVLLEIANHESVSLNLRGAAMQAWKRLPKAN